jgi:Ser/Thr protein kinase RdoA (MazF antagonist)
MWARPAAAEMLGRMHNRLRGFQPEGEECASWGAWTLETVDTVLESWDPLPELSPELLGIVREQLATRYFGEFYPQLPKLVIHGDFVASNVLWQKHVMGLHVSGVLDFERTHSDAAIFDFAWGLGDRRPPLLRATLSMYARVHSLTPVECEAVPEALLLAALMDIDLQLTYFHNLAETSRLAQELGHLVRDLEAIRRVARQAGGVRV